MLANKRKHKVIGRTKILTISTKLKNLIKYQGEFEGTNIENLFVLIDKNNILINHTTKERLRLKDRVVVTG